MEEKRDLILRNYQIPGYEFAKENDIAVLALASNGGKTEIAIAVISDYLKNHSNEKVLVLAHSRKELKFNFVERLEGLNLDFTYSTTFEENAQVHVCLPQSEEKIKGKYDFLIVDEAHENYHATRVQRIIKKTEVKKQLLLTASPARFIKEGKCKIYCLSINEILDIAPEYFSKKNIELVASKYNWVDEINSVLELKSSTKFTYEQDKEALKEITKRLLLRVKTKMGAKKFNKFKQDNLLTKLNELFFVIHELGKTLWICKSIIQANHIYKILKDLNVNCGMSNSETDIGCDELINFKNGMYDVLVVVDRAKIGYNDMNLFNLIDMSGTHNPNMIYQMIGRLLRGNPNNTKFYLKVTTQEYGMMDFTSACVCGALMLTDQKFLATFNGNNFKGLLIPVYKNKKNKNKILKPTRQKENSRFIFPEFTHDVIGFFKNVICNLDNPLSIYKTVTIEDVKNQLNRNAWTFENIVESTKDFNSLEEWMHAKSTIRNR